LFLQRISGGKIFRHFRRQYKTMKRIFLWNFIFMIMLLGGNSFCSAQSDVGESIQRKAKEKETIYITVTADKVKDTIASMEKMKKYQMGLIIQIIILITDV
jgi:hypothetical protein